MKNVECNIVMLPTEKAIDNGIVKMDFGKLIVSERQNLGNKIFDAGVSSSVYAGAYQPQHLYITNSNEEIKEGDWVYDSSLPNAELNKRILQVKNLKYLDKYYHKIIATTDESLKYSLEYVNGGKFGEYRLPRPSKEFIKKYCKLGGIDKVNVVYEEIIDNSDGMPVLTSIFKLKIAPDNTITINKHETK